MKDLFSPKQVALAINASESSVKRWCDDGKIVTVKTAGGHRRIPITGVVEFLRLSGRTIEAPQLLGLPAATTGGKERDISEEQSRLLNALVAGEESLCVQIVMNLYLAKYPMSLICDELLAKSFSIIGEKWNCGDVDVYQERRSCELCHRVMHEVRRLLPELSPNTPIAVGGTLDGDPYTLASSMAELVLRDLGWRANSLGNMLPFSSITRALCDTQPRLFWLSVSVIRDLDSFYSEFERLSTLAFENEVTLVVGGKALTEDVRRKMNYSAYCDTFQHLATIAKEASRNFQKVSVSSHQ